MGRLISDSSAKHGALEQSLFGLLLGLMVVGVGLGLFVSPAVASGHATYPLGKAKSCRAHFVKKTQRHLVKGREVRYVACVYVTPPAVTTTTGVPQYTVSLDSTSDIQYGLPIAQMDEITALVSGEPGTTTTPSGSASFFSNGIAIAACQNVKLSPNEFSGQPPDYLELSEASCTVQFFSTGTYDLSVKVTESDGALDVATLDVLVVP